jgi:hypothetical protein
MSEDESIGVDHAPRHSPRSTGRATQSAFSLEHKFFVDLRERLERERQRANEQHTSILNWLKHSITPPDGYSVALDTQKILHPPETIPPAEQLALLVQTAFWASLERKKVGHFILPLISWNRSPAAIG